MSKRLKIVLCVLCTYACVASAHAWLNLGLAQYVAGAGRGAAAPQVGFLPVTCHLTCPVAHWVKQNTGGAGSFEPVRFSGFPEIKEALVAGHLPATFMLAPMAMALRQQGVPVKIVYLGHRDGTAMMVHKDSAIRRIEDLKSKTVAVPNRFSNQYLILFKALKERGLSVKDVNVIEMPPPDMPAALYSRAVDAVTSGEPFMARTEMEGYGRALYQAKDIWPNFISCVLVVREDAIGEKPEWVQSLVDGIARSGKWLESDMGHRMKAAENISTKYYNQAPDYLRYVLSKPPDRVTYANLRLARQDFEQIEGLAREAGLLDGSVGFADYADTSFSDKTEGAEPYEWEGPR